MAFPETPLATLEGHRASFWQDARWTLLQGRLGGLPLVGGQQPVPQALRWALSFHPHLRRALFLPPVLETRKP